jgi:RNA polymerase sigma-70 factor, ECF subfamily
VRDGPALPDTAVRDDEIGCDGIGSVDSGDLARALAAARKGDEAGFEELWLALQPALLRYLRVVVGEAAEDVASETWLQAARDLRTFDGDPMLFRVWLFRVARNRAIDDRRRVRRRAEDPYDPGAQESRATSPDSAAQVLDGLGTQWALKLIRSLPPDQAEAVMLRVVAGLDVAPTAQVLGKRPGAVRVAAMRGLRRLANNPQVLARAAERDPSRSGAVEAAQRKAV